MRRNRIGRTSVEVTRLSFGSSGLGNLYRRIAETDAQAVLQRAWDRGIRYFDTAPHYGRGLSEARLGRLQAQAAGVDLATAALRFALTHPQAASVLIGTAKASSLDRNLDAAEAPWPESADSALQEV